MNRGTAVCLLGGIVAAVLWLGIRMPIPAYSQTQPTPMTTSSATAALSIVQLSADEAGDHIVVVDPTSKVMSTYYVARQSGVITLKSVRNLQWDFRLDEYNPSTPSPRDIRAVIEGGN